jgi:hypothetical protein
MAKAQGIVALIFIVILGIVIYYILSSINIPPPSEDRYQPPRITYSNDIITVENLEISETEPLPGTKVELSFYIKNNGDRTVPEAEVNFFSPFGKGITDFKIDSIECEDGGSFGTTAEGEFLVSGGCKFKEIKEGDMRGVKLKFTTPDKEPLAPIPYSIRYYIKYNYSGYRIANIPVVDGITVKQPSADFSQSTSTYGPVKLEFKPPVGGKEKIGEKVIERYWAVNDTTFKIEMELTHVGTLGKVYPINITLINLTLSQLQQEGYCDFDQVKVDNKILYLKVESKILYLDKPLKLVCQFKPVGSDPQYLAQIKAEFNYTYQFEKEQTIVVTPPLKK